MAKVKICGLRDETMLRVASDAGADWVGFVFFQKSVRAVTAEMVCDLPLKDCCPAVALLVNADDRLVDAVLETGISILQLHGQESPARVAELKTRTGAEIWKAHGIRHFDDLRALNEYEAADKFLLDAKPPKGSRVPGGHGNVFDWSVLSGWKPAKPWILSGGLTPENVGDAISATGAAAVDVSSGVERERGVKDETLIRSFIAAAKAA
ncbi:phosphoribosylanthranilate isomerase [Henriciella aquimarina]|uniref:phosphoribosylanthranilate isomerase n=1 Tax=Henriciella aquimarina TaxID=545261 RepID=UPI000A0368AE|nr:phosphoribosylanthranilate isomerase [Henriciella aquimarina]